MTVVALVLPAVLQLLRHGSLPSVGGVRQLFGPDLNMSPWLLLFSSSQRI